MVEEIRKKLHELSEEDYKTFNQKLLPGVEHVLGVRLPAMRKLAKEVAKGDFRSYLDEAAEKIGADSIHEEIMLQACAWICKNGSRGADRISGRVCAEDHQLGGLRQLCEQLQIYAERSGLLV